MARFLGKIKFQLRLLLEDLKIWKGITMADWLKIEVERILDGDGKRISYNNYIEKRQQEKANDAREEL